MKRIAIVILVLAATALALRSEREEWVTLGPFDGGLNIEVGKTNLEPNQLYQSQNFIWQDNALTVREGFARYLDPLSRWNLEFIDVFKRTDGQTYLIVGDGREIWYRTNLDGTATKIDIGRVDAGTVDCDADSTTVKGNSTKWRSLLGTGDGFTIVIDDTATRVIDYIQNDTVLYTTVAMQGDLSAVDYYIVRDNISLVKGLTFADQYWIYSNTGHFLFQSADSTGDIEEASGTRYEFTDVTKYLTHYLKLDVDGARRTGDFVQIVLNPHSEDSTLSAIIDKDTVYYMSYPVNSVSSDAVYLRCAAVRPDSTNTEYISFTNLEYDASTADTFTADSLVTDSIDGSYYYKLFAGGEGFTEETFRTGDWFFWPNNWASSIDSARSVNHLYCYPIVGGFIDTTSGIHANSGTVSTYAEGKYVSGLGTGWTGLSDSGAGLYISIDTAVRIIDSVIADTVLYTSVAWKENLSDTTYTIYSPDTAVIIPWSYHGGLGTYTGVVRVFRMTSVKAHSQEEGISFAEEYQRRVFYAHDSTCNEIEWSEPDMPDSHISTSSLVLNSKQGDCCVTAAQQRGDLIIYMDNSIFRLYGDGTNAGYGAEEVCDHIGCVSAKSLINVNNTEHYWLYSDGYYYSNGAEPIRVSDAVQSYFTDTLNAAFAYKTTAGYDEENNNVWISFPGGASTVNNKTLVYHVPTQSWWPQLFVAGTYYYNGDLNVSDSVRLMAGGVDSATTYWVNGTNDDGDSLSAYAQTPYMTFGTVAHRKRIKTWSLHYKNSRSGATVTYGLIRYYTWSMSSPDINSTTLTSSSEGKVNFYLDDGLHQGFALSYYFSVGYGSGVKLLDMQLKMLREGESE